MLSSAKEAVIYIHYVQEHAIVSEMRAWITVRGLASKPNNWDCFVLKTKIFAAWGLRPDQAAQGFSQSGLKNIQGKPSPWVVCTTTLTFPWEKPCPRAWYKTLPFPVCETHRSLSMTTSLSTELQSLSLSSQAPFSIPNKLRGPRNSHPFVRIFPGRSPNYIQM